MPRQRSPVVLVLLATMVLALAGVFWLGLQITEQHRWAIDLSLTLALQSHRSPALDWLLEAVSYYGFVFPFVPIIVAVAAAIAFLRDLAEGLLAGLGGASAYALTYLVQLIVERPRPAAVDVWVYQQVSGYSFPSGHVTTYTVFFGLLIYLALRHWAGRVYRWPVVIWSLLSILLVGPSRVYLGAHRPTDVLAGYLLGYAVLVGSILAFEALSPRFNRHLEPG